MEIGNQAGRLGETAARRFSVRTLAVIGALVLLAGALLLFQRPAQAQIPVNQFIVAILLAIRNAFANSPFFGFIAQILDALIASFGGTGISPG